MSLPAISNADYSAEIDIALDSAKNIIVIAIKKKERKCPLRLGTV